jgi:hypothetical protein
MSLRGSGYSVAIRSSIWGALSGEKTWKYSLHCHLHGVDHARWLWRHPQFVVKWDNANYLYALGFDGLSVFTVTTTFGAQTGATTPIIDGAAMAVLPKT